MLTLEELQRPLSSGLHDKEAKRKPLFKESQNYSKCATGYVGYKANMWQTMLWFGNFQSMTNVGSHGVSIMLWGCPSACGTRKQIIVAIAKVL